MKVLEDKTPTTAALSRRTQHMVRKSGYSCSFDKETAGVTNFSTGCNLVEVFSSVVDVVGFWSFGKYATYPWLPCGQSSETDSRTDVRAILSLVFMVAVPQNSQKVEIRHIWELERKIAPETLESLDIGRYLGSRGLKREGTPREARKILRMP